MKRKIFLDDMAAFRDVPCYMMFHDGVNTVFVLTRTMEIYHRGNGTLCCYCFDRKTYLQLKKEALIFDDHITDDGLYVFKTDRRNLASIIQLGRFSRRPHLKGKWIRDKEARLGHDILPFNSSEHRSYMERES